MKRDSARADLIQAANAIVEREGAASLTIDRVAAKAGLSKGGALYHFPSKKALISAMIEVEIEGFDARIDAAMGESKAVPGAFSRAYVDATLDGDPAAANAFGGLLAAVANDESVLEAYRERTEAWRGRMLADGIDPSAAEVIRLAVDGFYYSAVFGAALPSAEEIPAFRSALFALAGRPPR